MKPHVVVHMTTSIDGRTLPSRWIPKREGSTTHYEISVLVSPVVDGAPGAPALFDAAREDAGKRTKVKDIALASSEALEGGVVWLRYTVST